MIFPDVPITTERLELRPWEESDAEALGEAITASREHLRPWMVWIAHEPLPIEDRRALITGWQSDRERGEQLVLGVFLHDGTVVGGSGLHNRVGPHGLEIGYWVHADHCGQGIATEVATALTRAALSLGHIETVRIVHDVANLASGRVPAKLGFTRMGERATDPTAPAETGTDAVWELRLSDPALG